MRRALAMALVLAFGVAGAAHALTTHQYAARADKVCKRTNAKVRKLGTPHSAKDIGPLLKQTLAILRPAQRDLAAIALPRGKQRRTAREAVTLARQGVNLLAAASRKIERGADPLRTVTAAQPEIQRLGKRERRLWRALGARACASP